MNQNPKQLPRNETDADLSGRMRFRQAKNQFSLIKIASEAISLKILFTGILNSDKIREDEDVIINVGYCLMRHFVEQRDFLSYLNTAKND